MRYTLWNPVDLVFFLISTVSHAPLQSRLRDTIAEAKKIARQVGAEGGGLHDQALLVSFTLNNQQQTMLSIVARTGQQW